MAGEKGLADRIRPSLHRASGEEPPPEDIDEPTEPAEPAEPVEA